MGTKDQADILSLEDLEKSWGDSKDLLKSILDDEGTKKDESKKEPLAKSKDGDADDAEMDFDEEDDADEEDEDEDEDGEDKKGMKKSLEDTLQADEEAAAAMDVEPFLRKLVKSMSTRLSALESANAKLSNVLAKSLIAIGEQNLTIAATVNAIAETPVGTRSVIRKSPDRFPETKGGDNPDDLLKSMTKDQILEKSLSLMKSNKITSRDVAKIQNRLNKGIQLPAEYVSMLTEKGDK